MIPRPDYRLSQPPAEGYTLDACPFCGAPDYPILQKPGDYRVWCQNCGAMSTDAPNANYVIWVWNRRQQPQQPQADWNQAPTWAMWWCHRPTGYYWHEFEPYLSHWGEWTRNSTQSSGRRRHSRVQYVSCALPLGIDHRTIKQQRPQPSAPAKETVSQDE